MSLRRAARRAVRVASGAGLAVAGCAVLATGVLDQVLTRPGAPRPRKLHTVASTTLNSEPPSAANSSCGLTKG